MTSPLTRDPRQQQAQLLVGEVTFGKVPKVAAYYEREFQRLTKAAERTTAIRPRRRQSRAQRAIGSFRQAIFWRTLENDYADQLAEGLVHGDQKVLLLEDAKVILSRWEEAHARMTWATNAGLISPGRLSRAVEMAAGQKAEAL